jgi:hypothetical protein
LWPLFKLYLGLGMLDDNVYRRVGTASASWKLQVFIYFHRHLSAPAMSTDNSQVGVAICHPF